MARKPRNKRWRATGNKPYWSKKHGCMVVNGRRFTTKAGRRGNYVYEAYSGKRLEFFSISQRR